MATFGVLFCALLVVLFLADLRTRYHGSIDQAKNEALNHAEILADNTAVTFETVDRVLRETELIRQGALLGTYTAPDAANGALRHLAQTSPLVIAIGWTNAAGGLLAHSYGSSPPRANIADMSHFIVQRDEARIGLFITESFRSASGDRWFIAASRRLNGIDGQFAGVVTAALDPSYFNRVYRSFKLGNNGAILLLHRSGRLLAREPIVEGAVGKILNGSKLLTEFLANSDEGHYELAIGSDGNSRIVGYKAVSGLPLVLLVSYGRAEVLAPWYRHLYQYGSLLVLIVASVLAGTYLLVRQASKLDAKTIALEQKSEAIEQTNEWFDDALTNMSNGLSMFDSDGKLMVWNDKYVELYGMSPEVVRPGASINSIVEHRKQTNSPDLDVDAYVGEFRQTLIDTGKSTNISRLRDGRTVAVVNTATANGGWVAIHEDITERRRAEAEIVHLARHDVLTGLANRAEFNARLEEASKRLKRNGGAVTVMMLDLDKFKAVNDTLGHPAGDQLLVEVGRRLQSTLRETDVLARLGGDEFAIIQEGGPSQHEGAIALALRIIGAITQPFDLNGHEASVGTSIGIALGPEHGIEPEELLKSADLALYSVKTSGRNDFRIFQAELLEIADTQQSAEKEMRDAIAQEEFELHYQPVVDLKTRKLYGVEALVRWRHPIKGLIAPDQFIPLAESTGLIVPLGEWILQRACADAASWSAHITVAINISAVQFEKGNLFEVILCALVETGLAPERLELEITETSLLENRDAHLATIRQLKNLGISIALDDFGTGYSSMTYLTNFPFDKIKIDRSFTQGVLNRRDCAAVVSSVLALAQGIGTITTAEGIETEEQFEYMRDVGVDLAQGYLFGRPVPISHLDLNNTHLPKEMVA
jgi:diguanylate cyclase (GGDEF)-like protein/PAS domain S-box-containing protein